MGPARVVAEKGVPTEVFGCCVGAQELRAKPVSGSRPSQVIFSHCRSCFGA